MLGFSTMWYKNMNFWRFAVQIFEELISWLLRRCEYAFEIAVLVFVDIYKSNFFHVKRKSQIVFKFSKVRLWPLVSLNSKKRVHTSKKLSLRKCFESFTTFLKRKWNFTKKILETFATFWQQSSGLSVHNLFTVYKFSYFSSTPISRKIENISSDHFEKCGNMKYFSSTCCNWFHEK